MNRPQERKFINDAADMIEKVTGHRPSGYNCNWLRRCPKTRSLLQDSGYIFKMLNRKAFAVVRHTLRNTDILLIQGRNFTPGQFLDQINFYCMQFARGRDFHAQRPHRVVHPGECSDPVRERNHLRPAVAHRAGLCTAARP